MPSCDSSSFNWWLTALEQLQLVADRAVGDGELARGARYAGVARGGLEGAQRAEWQISSFHFLM